MILISLYNLYIFLFSQCPTSTILDEYFLLKYSEVRHEPSFKTVPYFWLDVRASTIWDGVPISIFEIYVLNRILWIEDCSWLDSNLIFKFSFNLNLIIMFSLFIIINIIMQSKKRKKGILN